VKQPAQRKHGILKSKKNKVTGKTAGQLVVKGSQQANVLGGVARI